MTPRNLSILVILGAVALGGGWYFGTATKPPQQVAVDSGNLMFPGLTARLKDATRIEIVNQGKTTTVALKDGRWGLAEREGYPIIDTKLRTMLTALTELRLLEPRTADPEQLRRLGVEDPDAKESKATLLRVLDGSGKPMVAVITGHRRVRTQGKVAEQIYVRRPGEAQAWLAEGALQVDSDPQLWLDRDVLNIDHNRIATAVASRGAEKLTFIRKDDKLILTAPTDHPTLDEYRVDDVGRALENVTFQDVQTNNAPVGERIGEGVFTTTDGLTISVTVFTAEKDILARFAFTGDEKARSEAEALSARLTNWTYRLGAWKEKALVPTLADVKKADSAAPAASAESLPTATPNTATPPSDAAPGANASGAAPSGAASSGIETPARAASDPQVPAASPAGRGDDAPQQGGENAKP